MKKSHGHQSFLYFASETIADMIGTNAYSIIRLGLHQEPEPIEHADKADSLFPLFSQFLPLDSFRDLIMLFVQDFYRICLICFHIALQLTSYFLTVNHQI